MNPYTFHINLYDLTFLVTVIVGLNFALLLGFTKSINQAANRFLALALAVIVLWMARILAIDINLSAYLPHWDRLPLQFSLAFGPLIYFYVLKLTRPEYKFRLKDMLHFSPLLLQLSVQVLEIRERAATGVATYNTPLFQQLNPVIQLLTFVSVVIYLYLSYELIERFYRRLKFIGGDRYRLEMRWLRNLLTGFGLLWLLWIPFVAADYFYYHQQLAVHAYYPLYLLLAAVFIRIAALAFLRPAVEIRANVPLVPTTPPPAELKQKGTWLKQAMKANRYYQDPELSLSTLAEQLAIHTHELSRIINTALKKNFNDFVNEYRVADVAAKMQDPAFDHITLLGIAFESGFNSKTTFNRTFKQMTGKSPAEYKIELKKERPTYNLERPARITPVILNQQTTQKWHDEKLTRNYMFRNYLKTAFRNLLKNKGFTAINILGLTLGLATCLLIVFYVFDELSYDKYNEKADRIYRVNIDSKFGSIESSAAVAPAPAAAALKADFPEIEQVFRFRFNGGNQVKKGTQNIREDAMVYADPTLFDVFTLPMISGDPETALKEPHTVVITEKIAKKYFNTTNAVGKLMTFNDTSFYKVTGVIRNIPSQSHFHFDFFLSMSNLAESRENVWVNNNFQTYILLRKGGNYKMLQAKLPGFLKTEAGPQFESVFHLNFDKMQQRGSYVRFRLIPLTDIHLKTVNNQGELEANGNIDTVYIFSAIAVLVLLIACVNFMNLSTARSANRAKEVGVRKVLGSPRKYLIAQFLTESIMVTLVAAIIAVCAAWALLGMFNDMSGKELAVTPHILLCLFPMLVLFVIVIGCIAGSYPALYLSGFQPIKVLKGKLAAGFKGSLLRNVLVVGQFVISIGLIIATLVIYNQLQYIQNKDIGYNREHILTVWDTWTLGSRATAFKQEVKQLAGVQNATMSSFLPTNGANINVTLYETPITDQKQAILTSIWYVDKDYIPTLGMKVMSGRNFSNQMATDSTAIIVNESAAKLLAFRDPLNKPLYAPMDELARVMKPYHIIGVVKDFNFKSLRENVTPMVLFNIEDKGALTIRTGSTNIKALLDQLSTKWAEMSPGHPFDYSFMDQDFDKLYSVEQRTGKIATSFTSLAVIIACLGLFGLAAYAAEQRAKEIGIRKVLGANVAIIVGMLSKDFIRLVVLAIVIGVPIAWWAMQTWLQGYAYHQGVQWWIIAVAGFGAVIIAFVTISFQSIKAALTNPMKSLRSE